MTGSWLELEQPTELVFSKLQIFGKMLGFDPRTLGVGSDRSANWAIITAQ